MYTPYFEAFQTLFKDRLNTVQTIAYYNQQYQSYDTERPPALPALYIEFGTLEWTDLTRGHQQADASITLHIVVQDLADNLSTLMSIAHDVHTAIDSRTLSQDDKTLSTSLTRTRTQLLTPYTQTKVMQITYNTTLYYSPQISVQTASDISLELKAN